MQDFCKSAFLHQGCRLLCIKPFALALPLLGPIIELSLYPKQEDQDLADDRLFGEPLIVMEAAQRSLPDNLANQASFLISPRPACGPSLASPLG
jgi:hypothetical protein